MSNHGRYMHAAINLLARVCSRSRSARVARKKSVLTDPHPGESSPTVRRLRVESFLTNGRGGRTIRAIGSNRSPASLTKNTRDLARIITLQVPLAPRWAPTVVVLHGRCYWG